MEETLSEEDKTLLTTIDNFFKKNYHQIKKWFTWFLQSQMVYINGIPTFNFKWFSKAHAWFETMGSGLDDYPRIFREYQVYL